MFLTRLAVYRPLVALTMLAAILLFGIVSYLGLGLDQLPEIKTSIVTVQVPYPGAGPREVEEQVTRKVEDALAGLNDVDELSSISTQSLSTTTIKFHENVDIDLASLDVERAVNNIRRDLPDEVDAPTVRKIDLNDTPILYLALTNRGNRDPTDLYQLANDTLRPRLEGLEGVSSARVLGGQVPEVGVELLPERLRAYHLGITDVTSAIQAQYQSLTGGLLRPSGAAASGQELVLRIEGRPTDPARVADLTITARDGTVTRLGQVATITFGGADKAAIVRLNGVDSIGILVSKQTRANITQSADRVLAEVDTINASLPADLRLETVIDRSTFIRKSVADVERELGLAALLTGVVLLLFLHTVRATVIVVLAIPTSIVATFILMKLGGLSLNFLSLLGLTTSIGILVDDSIVVLENIWRHLERGEEPKEAALKGRAEIGRAALAITLVDVVVYGPIIFLQGTTGGFLRNFALVLAAATLFSLVMSFTLTPLLSAAWLQTHGRPSLIARIAGFWEPAYKLLERAYGRLLGWSLRHRPLVLLGAVGLFVASIGLLLPRLGFEFVPNIDSPVVLLAGELPGGTTLGRTDLVARQWEGMLLDRQQFPEIQQVYTVVGSGSSDLDRGSRYLNIIIELVPRSERSRGSSQIQRAALDAAAVIPSLKTSVGGSRAGGGSGQAAQVRLVGRDGDELARAADALTQRLARHAELVDVSSSNAAQAPVLVAVVDQARLRDLGLTTQQVGSAVRIAYQGIVPARFPRPDGTEEDIRVRLPASFRGNAAQVQDLPLLTSRGDLVTLGQVAQIFDGSVPARINRLNRQRVVTVGAEPFGVALGQATTILTDEVRSMQLPPTVRWELAGQSKDQQDSFRQLALALGVSVVLVYLVLTALYESLVTPLVIISALPLALIGALGGLLVFHITLNILSLIGVVALFGLVGKNSILLVDYTNQLRHQGLERNAALLEAGPARLRPILMTSATLVFGLLPVALQLGEGGELRAPLAAVIIGGMVSSTVLTLVFVPVSYSYFDGLQHALGRLIRFRPRLLRRQRALVESSGPPPLAPAPANGDVRAAGPPVRSTGTADERQAEPARYR